MGEEPSRRLLHRRARGLIPRLLDISPPIHPGLAVWPGDTPYRRQVALSLAGGDNLELSSIHTTVHLGAHADAPSHYVPGPMIGARDPRLYVGPCEVMHVEVGRGERIPSLPRTPRHPRVLLRTGTYPDPTVFNEDFAALSVALVHELVAAGVRLIGIDTPSVDLCHDRALEAHHAIAEHDLAILEGIVLDTVPEGEYTLLAQPLPLDADASPVRALLLTQLIEELL